MNNHALLITSYNTAHEIEKILTSLFNASSTSNFSSFKLSLILALLIFSMRGFFACEEKEQHYELQEPFEQNSTNKSEFFASFQSFWHVPFFSRIKSCRHNQSSCGSVRPWLQRMLFCSPDRGCLFDVEQCARVVVVCQARHFICLKFVGKFFRLVSSIENIYHLIFSNN